METFDLDINSLEPLEFDTSKSMNFGSGAELLMNTKKTTSQNSNINLGDLESLESELNNLSGSSSMPSASSKSGSDTNQSGQTNSIKNDGPR